MRYRLALAAGVLTALVAVGGVAAAWQRTGEMPRPAHTAADPSQSSGVGAPTVPSPSAGVETADRIAGEQAWQRFLNVYRAIESHGYSKGRWPAVVDEVAVEPTRSQVIREATEFDRRGIVVYGKEVSRPYWIRPVAGTSTAVMADCMDASHTGTMYEKTGVKRTVGKPRSNTRVTLVRGPNEQWRVKLIEYLVDQPC